MLHVSLEDKKYKRFWGLARTLVANNIIGVSRQFTLKLELVGVGYRAELLKEDNRVLELQLGFSHNILLDIPEGITVECDLKKENKYSTYLEIIKIFYLNLLLKLEVLDHLNRIKEKVLSLLMSLLDVKRVKKSN